MSDSDEREMAELRKSKMFKSHQKKPEEKSKVEGLAQMSDL